MTVIPLISIAGAGEEALAPVASPVYTILPPQILDNEIVKAWSVGSSINPNIADITPNGTRFQS